MTSSDEIAFPRQQAKIQSLEGLRGLMAWWVVLGHISLSFNFHIPVIDRNTLPVDVFIILSGFVIARLVDQKSESYPAYIIRRGFRIVPLYFVVLLISTLLLGVQAQAWTQLQFVSSSNMNRIALANEALGQTFPHLLAHLTLLHGVVPDAWLPSAAYTLVGQAWSISLEWQFYLVAPLIMGMVVKRGQWVLLAVIAIALMIAGQYFSNGFLGNRILQFMIGIFTYLAFDRIGERKFWTVLAVVFAAFAIIRNGPWQLLPLALWAVVIVSAASSSLSIMHVICRIFNLRLLRHLGDISYSTYLVHMIPLYSSIFVLEHLKASSAMIAFGATVFTIMAAYGLGLLLFNFIEKPGMRLGKMLVSRFGLREHERRNLAVEA